MEWDSLQVYRLRYLLAKFSQSVHLRAYGETENTIWLKNFIENEFEIEHIHPQNPCVEAIEEFGEVTVPNIAQKLGNLVLVEKPINASLGNKPYSAKKTVYPQSSQLLAQAIAEKPKVGSNTSIDRAVRDLQPFAIWNQQAVIDRQNILASFARSIWNVPQSALKAPEK
jgi:Protein of unknown function (DUF1524)